VTAVEVTGAAATGVVACGGAGDAVAVAAADPSGTVRHGAVSVTDGIAIAAGGGSGGGAAGSGTERHGGVGATG
jgi:hypothetical protein